MKLNFEGLHGVTKELHGFFEGVLAETMILYYGRKSAPAENRHVVDYFNEVTEGGFELLAAKFNTLLQLNAASALWEIPKEEVRRTWNQFIKSTKIAKGNFLFFKENRKLNST